MKFKFILENKVSYSVEKMCKHLKLSKNSFYHWLKTKDLIKVKDTKRKLMDDIKLEFEKNKQIYGSQRVQKSLAKIGVNYSRSYVATLMKDMGLKSVLRRKYVVTTNSKHEYPVANNVLNREFSTLNLGEKWVSDITYIRVKDQWNYLTTIIDLADRKIVGWALSEDMTTENTILKAWYHARSNRDIHENFIFHSDRGVQYAANKMTSLFKNNRKITQSMSRKGNCWDNAVAESFFKTIKHECLNRYFFSNFNQLYNCLKEYITWYNTIRLHSSLGFKSPLEKELELRKNKNHAA